MTRPPDPPELKRASVLAPTGPGRPPAAPPEPPGDSRFLTPEEPRAELKAAGPPPDNQIDPAPTRPGYPDITAALICKAPTPGPFTFDDQPVVERTPEEVRKNRYEI